MKVQFLDKQLRKTYSAVISVISTFISFVLIFFPLPEECSYRGILAFSFFAILLIIYVLMWIEANKRKKASITINGMKVTIEEGDIFEETDALKVIPFNEYFDTIVDEKIISSRSLHGQFILKYYSRKNSDLQEEINRELFQKGPSYISSGNNSRMSGNTTCYKLGTTVRLRNFALVAFSRFDKQNRAYLDNKSIWICLINMWHELDTLHSGSRISLPLMGTGITRKIGMNLSEQEILELIIFSLKSSGVRFGWNSPIRIVVHKANARAIDFYSLTKYSDKE